MRASDVDQAVEVHLRSFQGFFLTFLGAPFLRLLYRYLVTSPDGLGHVCLGEGEQVLGFICGTTCASFYRKFFVHEWWHVIAATVWPLIQRPSIARRLARAVVGPARRHVNEAGATLMSVAVLPEWQGKGIGGALVAVFLAEMRLRGVSRVYLTTDREGNDSTNAFYRRMGFQLSDSFVTPEGRPMNEYAINLGAAHDA
jgi:ribosomal protein S18 acetylase RimI-like enzyme